MKPKVHANLPKDWNLFFNGDRDGLYTCFMLFYDDFYRLGLHWYKNPDLVKECIHNLFLELWKSWNARHHVTNKKQYVLTIYKRLSHKTFLAYTRTETETAKLGNSQTVHELPYEDLLIASQTEEHRSKQLQAALRRLTKRQKEIIKLRFYEGLSISQIAQSRALTERTVYNTLHNAIKVLRECLVCLLYTLAYFQ